MRSLYSFIVEPKEGRYNNNKKIGDKELILNSSIGTMSLLIERVLF
jgi:hypothetical protein